MARRKPATVSQRKAVVRRKASAASSAKKKKPPLPVGRYDTCDEKTTAVQFAKGNNSQLQLAACCKIIRNVFDKGYANAHPVSKRELKQFMAMLRQEVTEGMLLDYCYIQFDLKKDELARVQTAVALALV